MFILHHLFLILTFFVCLSCAALFSPDRTDYDAYGPKIAGNRFFIVQVDNEFNFFNFMFANYTDAFGTNFGRYCYRHFDSSWYIYAVAVGKNQSTPGVYFIGEIRELEENQARGERIFFGFWKYTGSLDVINCYYFNLTDFTIPNEFTHQEYLALTTDPYGLVAYAFSESFIFTYTPSTNRFELNRAGTTILGRQLEHPSAVDNDGSLSIIAGYRMDFSQFRAKFYPMVILFRIDATTAMTSTIAVWDGKEPNTGANRYNPQYAISVSMNPNVGQVIVGMPLINTVLLFNYNNTNLTLVALLKNGQGNGFGKGVAWLSDTLNSVAILANVYSDSYVWSSSKIYVYDSPLTNNSKPISIFPNSEQPLYRYVSPIFLNIVATPNDLMLLTDQGGLFVILSAPIGYYASTVGPLSDVTPAFSSQESCLPGTYKNVTGIRRCSLCPTGTKNDGTNGAVSTCVACAVNTFCPLGSVSDSISNDQLIDVIQAVEYPESPDITGIDDILFFTLFSIGSSARCVALSPIFWTLMVAAIIILIVTVMLVIKYCIKNPKALRSYKLCQKMFKQADIIREGEMWAGGLATFCVLVLCISCCVFSAKYYKSYPIEAVGPSTYTCDTTLRNAQFSSSLQSLAVPSSDNIQGMMDLLNNQRVSLTISFLNTAYNCNSTSGELNYQRGETWLSVEPKPSCTVSNYTVSYSALLPFRPITIQSILPYAYAIGGLRIGLSGPGKNEYFTATLQELGFSKTFNQSERILGTDVNVTLELTKVINKTSPLVKDGDEILSGIWIGSFIMNYNASFINDTYYLNAIPKTSTILTLTIIETPYYILNGQSPIARLPEIVYHDFLYITTVIGMTVLVFIIVEVVILPIVHFFIRKYKRNPGDKYRTDSNRQSVTNPNNARNSIDHSNEQQQSNRHTQNFDTVDNFASAQRSKYTSDQYVNPSDNNTQQLPTLSNYQTHF
ncbi:unnamed protein product [Rotaria socialis]|uniref:Uncharacterized protein n=1 Tax=Rotaria socialis TaxID=392032 RepID=A0A818DCZ4_9BILA|nr:unnamed protein product [Rotaria socialis]CAF4463626.1 unnamed protein product [Rotaria socialis]